MSHQSLGCGVLCAQVLAHISLSRVFVHIYTKIRLVSAWMHKWWVKNGQLNLYSSLDTNPKQLCCIYVTPEQSWGWKIAACVCWERMCTVKQSGLVVCISDLCLSWGDRGLCQRRRPKCHCDIQRVGSRVQEWSWNPKSRAERSLPSFYVMLLWVLCAAVRVCVCTCLTSPEQSTAAFSVPPDVTLLSSGADPTAAAAAAAAEVGRPTASLFWVGENRREFWAGWR